MADKLRQSSAGSRRGNLSQIVRGSVAIGMERREALRLAIRCARDSMPPLRLAIIEDLAGYPHSSTSEVRKRLDEPRNTVDRQLQALHILGVVTVDEEEYSADGRSRWFYTLADGVDPSVLDPECVPEMSFITPNPSEESERETEGSGIGSDKSGTPRRPDCLCADRPDPCYWCQAANNGQAVAS